LEWLARMGLKIRPRVDLNDVARHPEKYADREEEPEVEIEGMEEFQKNMEELEKLAESAERDLDFGKIASSIGIASQIDPYFAILQVDPNQYADPMNVLIQKQNFAVHNRKTNLYRGYLYSINKRTSEAIWIVIEQTKRKIDSLLDMRNRELGEFEKQKEARILRNKAGKVCFDSGEIPDSTPLFKKLDEYGTDFNFGLVKGRIS
jgi:hypothetical protein